MVALSLTAVPTIASGIEFSGVTAQQRRIRAGIDHAVARVIDHGQFIMGPEVGVLERQLADFCGARNVITCASGTDALLIAMMALNVRPGDAVLCPAFTYTATPETIVLLGASPVFVDVEPETFNVDPLGLAAGITAARHAGLRPVGVIAVDLFGLPADYDGIAAFASENNLWVLADAAQSFGAEREGRKVGKFGHITATSFFPAKPLGCYGDGGAIFTDDDDLAATMRSMRLHGKGSHKYDIVRIGVNSRLDTLQAAILLEKLKIFPEEIGRRQAVARRYNCGLSEWVVTPRSKGRSTGVWAQYTIRVPGGLRNHLQSALSAQGIPTSVFYPKPLHHQVAFRIYPRASVLAGAEQLPHDVLSLPMHPYLAKEVQDFIIGTIWQAIERQ